MIKKKEVYTTGEVADICNVAPRTVSSWFDTGTLGGYRIPGSKDRRVPHDELIKLMKKYNIPIPHELWVDSILVVFGKNTIVPKINNSEVIVFRELFLAGATCAQKNSSRVYIDFNLFSDMKIKQIRDILPDTKLICFFDDSTNEEEMNKAREMYLFNEETMDETKKKHRFNGVIRRRDLSDI